MPKHNFPRDRFDEIPRDPSRVGAHRAPRPRLRWLVTLLWWLLTVAVLTGGGIFAFLALSNTGAIDPPEAPSATATEPADVEPEIDTSAFLVVLNGTSSPNAATDVEAELMSAGWADDLVAVFDSDTTDFQVTTVYYVAEEDRARALGVAEAIGGAEVVQSEEFKDQSEDGFTVVVGLDRISE
jgi:uncharacterized membrane protein YdfJ with MMPL/SSD domain